MQRGRSALPDGGVFQHSFSDGKILLGRVGWNCDNCRVSSEPQLQATPFALVCRASPVVCDHHATYSSEQRRTGRDCDDGRRELLGRSAVDVGVGAAALIAPAGVSGENAPTALERRPNHPAHGGELRAACTRQGKARDRLSDGRTRNIRSVPTSAPGLAHVCTGTLPAAAPGVAHTALHAGNV
jgi:hypothetical protein